MLLVLEIKQFVAQKMRATRKLKRASEMRSLKTIIGETTEPGAACCLRYLIICLVQLHSQIRRRTLHEIRTTERALALGRETHTVRAAGLEMAW
jgi:hypothetical protein